MVTELSENFSIHLFRIKLVPSGFSGMPSIKTPIFNPEKFDHVFLNGCIPDH
jgi:hypothetical protein